MLDDPRLRAIDHITATLDSAAVERMLSRKSLEAPGKAKRAVAAAAEWWLGQAMPHIPVRMSVTAAQRKAGAKGPLYSKVGRGMLRKSTKAFTVERGGDIMGGLMNPQDYAIWLTAGTRRIAGGAVMAWQPGDPLVRDWPAKHTGATGGGDTAMPILRPWHGEARDKLAEELRKEVL